jgi:hypothetical protein
MGRACDAGVGTSGWFSISAGEASSSRAASMPDVVHRDPELAVVFAAVVHANDVGIS